MKKYSVGVVSDTHGLLRPEAVEALAGSDLIVHAGDVGAAVVLDRLEEIAPVFAVRGNVDLRPGVWGLPDTRIVEVGEARLYVLHDINQLSLDPRAAGFDAVISGHSHKPLIESRNGVLFINPGSAGPRRFHLPITLARLTVTGRELSCKLVALEVG